MNRYILEINRRSGHNYMAELSFLYRIYSYFYITKATVHSKQNLIHLMLFFSFLTYFFLDNG
jgi:hypothetical protein